MEKLGLPTETRKAIAEAMSYTIAEGFGERPLYQIPTSAMSGLMQYVEHLENIIICKALDQYLAVP